MFNQSEPFWLKLLSLKALTHSYESYNPQWQIQSDTADLESAEKVMSQTSGNKAIPKLKSIHRAHSKRTERQKLAAHTGQVWVDEDSDDE